MTEKRASQHTRLGYMLPILLFVLFFVLCSGVLACVFLKAETVSNQAGNLNSGVQLCRNEAERFRSGVDAPEGKLVCYYNEDLQPVDEADAQYYVTLEASREPSGAGNLDTAVICAFTMAGERLYDLDVTVYRPDGR